MTRTPNAVQVYMSDLGMYGGAVVTRGELIRDLDSRANGDIRLREAYLMGWRPHQDQEEAGRLYLTPENLLMKELVLNV